MPSTPLLGRMVSEHVIAPFVGADRLPNPGKHNWNKRKYFFSIKIGREEKKTKTFTSKRPVSSEPVNQQHEDAEVGSISVSVKSIIESRNPGTNIVSLTNVRLTYATDGSCIVNRDITSCPGAQLEFIIKMTDPRSVTTEMSFAVAETRGPLANLSSPSAIQGAITVKDDLGKIGGAAETAQEALSLIVKTIDVGAFMEKVEMFLPIVDGISEVCCSCRWSTAYLIVCGYTGSLLCEDNIVTREGTDYGK
ncbi:hypothetical protein PHLCEN_2v3228 [Hermanssonia centrifuga]|uniref:Uncharacterized protein n=1 Tax=Hermanssonia centrifuga TaxID=98765 RepID=A0A2R6QXN2_9APHY|nr:hypothetical protein PHLCEN_2v3228 [Hermanssonia centrifuga]